MNYFLVPAEAKDVDGAFSLYVKRVRWMEDRGIRHWNVNGYLDIHNISYFKAQQKLGNLYVLKRDKNNKVVGAAVLLDVDPRWPDGDDMAAFYVHNFVAAPDERGAGRILLQKVEDMGAADSRAFVRLDCTARNETLNRYYDELGFLVAGCTNSGFYMGYLREKRIHVPRPKTFITETVFTIPS